MKIGKIIFGAMLIASAATVSMAAEPEAIFKRCVVCHGKSAEKVPPGGVIVSATLSADEIKKSLKLYKSDKEHGGKMKVSMQTQVKNLSDEDIDAVADYIFKNFHIAK
ncbi:MAG: c-type cytochrome [Campylobacteraceae bacterium]|jgi:cytochrome c|nr:c-type cytochrome [Campylobacteraceae bacterium]